MPPPPPKGGTKTVPTTLEDFYFTYYKEKLKTNINDVVLYKSYKTMFKEFRIEILLNRIFFCFVVLK